MGQSNGRHRQNPRLLQRLNTGDKKTMTNHTTPQRNQTNTHRHGSRRLHKLLAATIVAITILQLASATTGPTDAQLIIHDTSGYERHTGIAGNATISDGAIKLNGSYLQTGSFPTSPSAQTVAFRFILNSTKPASAGTTQGLWHDGASATTNRLFIADGEAGTISIMPLATAHSQVTSTLGVSTNTSYVLTWRFQHIPITGPSFSSLSINGAEWINVTSIGSLGPSPGGPKYVGISTLSGASGPGNICNCTFEWLRYYNRVINESEIDSLINSTAPTTGKEIEYTFDETWDYGPPIASWTGTAFNLTLSTNAIASYTLWPGSSLSYGWDWGDGSGGPNGTNYVQNSHTYSSIGTFNVTLTVTDTLTGQTHTTSANVTIGIANIVVINNEALLPKEFSIPLAIIILIVVGGAIGMMGNTFLNPIIGVIAETFVIMLSKQQEDILLENTERFMAAAAVILIACTVRAYLRIANPKEEQE